MDTLLAIGAHPDDIEIHCGGTLAKFSNKGYKVIMAYICNGDAGEDIKITEKKEIARIRAIEAKNSAKIINAKSLGLNISDGNLYINQETRNIITNLIREVNPNIIITHFSEDYMPDHVNTSKLVFEASFIATNPSIITGKPACKNLSYLYFMEPMGGIDFLPSDYVNIDDYFEIKRKMLMEHKSQLKWMKKLGNLDIDEYIYVLARFRGIQVGIKYAEAFKLCKLWNRIPTKQVLC